MKILSLLLLLFMTSAQAAPLSTWLWDQAAREQGLRIAGGLTWFADGCDFENPDVTHPFPVFSYKKPSGKLLKEATGSFCVRLEIPEDGLHRMMHLSIIRVFGNGELLINGRPVWTQDLSTGPRAMNVLYDVQDRRLDIELKLSCNDSPACGVRGALHVEDQRRGTRLDLLRYSWDSLALAGILSCFFYHLIFAFLRRRSSAALFLAINALALLLRIALTGQGQMHLFFGIPESWYWRLETLAVLLLLPSTLSLVRAIFIEETPPMMTTLAWVISFSAMAFMLLPPRIFVFILALVYLIVLLNIGAYVVVAYRGLRNHRSGALIFIICALINVVSTALEVLNARLNVEMHAAVQPVACLVTMIIQSVLLATRINDAFVLAETQETEIKTLKGQLENDILTLDQKISERTAELRTIFQSISTGILWINWNEKGELVISSEYSEFLRKTLGFDIQSWHEFHFFLRRISPEDLPKSGKDLEKWFQGRMQRKDELDRNLDALLGGLRVFDDMDRSKHLKFKWVALIEDEKLSELFIFVFDVTLSMDLQIFALYKNLEVDALRELAAQSGESLAILEPIWDTENMADISYFASSNELQFLEKALAKAGNHLPTFVETYKRVLKVLVERYRRSLDEDPFDLDGFLAMPDWQQLPVDARTIHADLVKLRKSQT